MGSQSIEQSAFCHLPVEAEPALVAKPCRTTKMRRLPPGGYEFFSALRAGLTIGDAAAAVTQAAPEFEIASNLTLLAESKIAMELG
jgi:hypothetical protein